MLLQLSSHFKFREYPKQPFPGKLLLYYGCSLYKYFKQSFNTKADMKILYISHKERCSELVLEKGAVLKPTDQLDNRLQH